MARKPCFTVWDYIMARRRPPGCESLFRSYSTVAFPAPVPGPAPVQRTALTMSTVDQVRDLDILERVRSLLPLVNDYPPTWVGDQIVPVVDLVKIFEAVTGSGASLATAPNSGLTPQVLAAAIAGYCFQGWVPLNFAGEPPAGEVMVGQVFNPFGSDRLVIVERIMEMAVGASDRAGRYYNVPLANSTPPFNILENVNRHISPLTGRSQVRWNSILAAQVPPSGAGSEQWSFVASRGGDLVNQLGGGMPILQEGEGFIWFPVNNAPAANSNRAPVAAQVMLNWVRVMEFPS